MISTPVERTIDTLTEDSPSYIELVSLYRSLQEPIDGTPDEIVAKQAITQIVGELIDYLDLVADELEKSIGLTRAEERRRLLSALDRPDSDGSIQQVYELIEQWQKLERYSYDELTTGQSGFTI